MTEYSIIIPVFNGADSLEELFQRIGKVMHGTGKSYEVIFVDDHSRDASWNTLVKIQKTNPAIVTAIRLARNFGQHNATVCGVANCRGNYILTMDDDLQNPPEEIPKLIDAMKNTDADLVYGIYKNKKHSLARNMGSSALRASSHYVYSNKGKGSSFRLMKSSLGKNLLNHQLNFIFIDELFNWYTSHIEFVTVEHHKPLYRRSTYNPRNLYSMFSNLVIYYTALPLRIMVWGGFTSSFISLLIGLWFIYRKIFHSVPLGFTALIVAVLFSTSIILLSLGVIGEYLSRIYTVQNRKPPFAIKNIFRDEVL
jgi:polyisoprenyl-phosphate glycosyltransferase